MASITTRQAKGAPLTNAELDANFVGLNGELAQKLIASANLADLTHPTSARSNLGLSAVENKSSAAIREELTSSNITQALGYTPYSAANPQGFADGATIASLQTQLAETQALALAGL